MGGKPHIHKYTIEVPLGVQNDLNARLGTMRWPEQLANIGWEQGTNELYLQELVKYWREDFSWQKQQSWLNTKFNNFKLKVDGLNLHFVHHRSQHADAKPLLLIHGWPGSFIEFHKIIPELVSGREGQSFHVVAPSLPGFGFSEAPKSTGFGVRKIAALFDKLMRELGYPRYLAQGGDWGAIIGYCIGAFHHDTCLGLHTNMPLGAPKLGSPWTYLQWANATFLPQIPLTLTEGELQGLQQTAGFSARGTGYQAIQKTKPQTLGYGLNDSPVGLAAWITEKFHGWTDCDGRIENVVSKDELLTNISIYWYTGTITSSMRLYYESMDWRVSMLQQHPNKTPTAASRFPKELYVLPRSWVEACNDLKQWTEHKKGGHFAALEQPEALLADMLAFYKTISL